MTKQKKGPIEFMKELSENFGWQFVLCIFSTYFGIKGVVYALLYSVQLPYYMDYVGVSSATLQLYRTISNTPWSMKSSIGMLSDTVPIGGYHKGPYIKVMGFFGAIAFLVFSAIPLEKIPNYVTPTHYKDESGVDISETKQFHEPSDSVLPPILFFLITLQVATVDLLTEGQYAKLMCQKPETSSALVTWVWFCYFIGGLLMSAVVGPVADNFNIKFLFYLGIPFSLQLLIPHYLGYFGEEKVPQKLYTDKVMEKPRMYVMGALMTLGALGITFTALTVKGHPALLAVICWVWSFFMCSLGYWAMDRRLASCNTYMFLCNALYFGLGGPTDAFLTGNMCHIEDGPNFSYTYYVTFIGIVGNLLGMLGVSLFHFVFKNSTFRRAFWMTTVMRIAGSMFDVCMVNRWHRPYIPDKIFYLFGNTVVEYVVYWLDFMPAVVLVSKLCPKGYEALVYALLAGFQNFGQMVARYSGLYAQDKLNVIFERGHCEYENFGLLIFLTQMVLPAITIPLTFVLLPNNKLTDVLIKEDEENDENSPYDEKKVDDKLSEPESNNMESDDEVTDE